MYVILYRFSLVKVFLIVAAALFLVLFLIAMFTDGRHHAVITLTVGARRFRKHLVELLTPQGPQPEGWIDYTLGFYSPSVIFSQQFKVNCNEDG